MQVDLSSSWAQHLVQQIAGLQDKMKKVSKEAQAAMKGEKPLSTLKSTHQGQVAVQEQLEAGLQRLQANGAVLGAGAPAVTEALQALRGGAQKELEEALAALAQDIKHFEGLHRGINATDSWGDLPLHDAVSAGELALVRLLLPRTPYINVANNNGQPPLDKATQYSAIDSLLQASGTWQGIDGEVRARFGRGVNEGNTQGHSLSIKW